MFLLPKIHLVYCGSLTKAVCSATSLPEIHDVIAGEDVKSEESSAELLLSAHPLQSTLQLTTCERILVRYLVLKSCFEYF
jgi:hypothetical protein